MTETTQPYPRCPWCEAHPQPCGDHAARKPLTVADIPAGQGAASLYIAPDIDGDPTAWFKTTGGGRERLYPKPWHSSPGENALWDHLAATLPTIDTTEESK